MKNTRDYTGHLPRLDPFALVKSGWGGNDLQNNTQFSL